MKKWLIVFWAAVRHPILTWRIFRTGFAVARHARMIMQSLTPVNTTEAQIEIWGTLWGLQRYPGESIEDFRKRLITEGEKDMIRDVTFKVLLPGANVHNRTQLSNLANDLRLAAQEVLSRHRTGHMAWRGAAPVTVEVAECNGELEDRS